MKKRIAILGSTGSIGIQTLEVVDAQNEQFEIEILTAQKNAELLIKQAVKYKPNAVVIGEDSLYDKVHSALDPLDIKVYCGRSALNSVVENENIDIVLTALVGYSGLLPTINAIKAGKTIALANKETLVVAGDLVTRLAIENKAEILPVDSEHSAIFQCLVGEFYNPAEKIILTASGGPFRGKDRDFLAKVTKEQALKHPNWSMGAKITVDSASLMNKGLEVIEAKWLFGLKREQIDVVIHPQSIIHSMVQFEDGSIKAQMGLPDMKLPIQYALGFPKRIGNSYERLDFSKFNELTFQEPDTEVFRNLALAYHALEKGGNAPCILNAANEVAVDAFLKDKISFLGMSDLVEYCLEKGDFVQKPDLNCYIDTDQSTRKSAEEYLKRKKP